MFAVIWALVTVRAQVHARELHARGDTQSPDPYRLLSTTLAAKPDRDMGFYPMLLSDYVRHSTIDHITAIVVNVNASICNQVNT